MLRKIFGLEIGTNNIRVVELREGPKGLYLSRIGSAPTPPQALRQGEIVDIEGMANAVKQLFKSSKITAEKGVVSLSGRGIIIQQTTFPTMPASELKEVIRGELERYPILPPNNFIFDYHEIAEETKKGKRKTKVFFVGLSHKLFNSYINCLQKAGLIIEAVDIVPLSATTSLYKELSEDEETALVTVGDDMTYVTILKKGRFHLFYNIEIGANQIFSSPKESDITLNESALSGLIRELDRSFKFYKIEFPREDIKKVLLSLDALRHPQLSKIISSALGKDIPVIIANPMKNINFNSKAFSQERLNEISSTFSISIGAAMRGMGMINHEISLELLQAFIPKPRELKKRIIMIAALFFMVGAATFSLVAFQNAKTKALKQKFNSVNTQVQELDSKLAELGKIRQEYTDIKNGLERQETYLNKLRQVSWSVVLLEVTRLLPDDCWLTEVRTTEEGEIDLKGNTSSLDSVANFIKNLNDNSMFESTKLDFTQRDIMGKETIVRFGVKTLISQGID